MVQAKQNETQDTQTSLTSKLNNSAVKRSLAGGLIGAAVGYLATAENGKKIKENINGEKLSNVGQGIKENSVKAVDSVKNSASKLFSKENGKGEENDSKVKASSETSNETSLTSGQESNQEEETNEQTEQLNSRLDRLEDMLLKLIEEKKAGNATSKTMGNEEKTNASNESKEEVKNINDENSNEQQQAKEKGHNKLESKENHEEQEESKANQGQQKSDNSTVEDEQIKKKVSDTHSEKNGPHEPPKKETMKEDKEEEKGYSVLSDEEEEESVLLPGFKKESS